MLSKKKNKVVGIIEKVKYYQVFSVIKKQKISGYNMKIEILLHIFFFFFSWCNIKSEILLSIVCYLKKKFLDII